MSARMSRAELAVLVDEAVEFIEEWDVARMDPRDGFNLGLLAGLVNSINVGLHG